MNQTVDQPNVLSRAAWLRGNLDVAWMHHNTGNYVVSVPICVTLLKDRPPPIEKAECHLMMATAPVSNAMRHITTANTLLREAMDRLPDSEHLQELYLVSQEILRTLQALEREAREGGGSGNPSGTTSLDTFSEDFPDDSSIFDTAEEIFSASTSPSPSSSPLAYASPERGRSRHRRRHSGAVDTNLAPIEEEDQDQYPSYPVPASRPPVRRLSSLGRAAKRLAESTSRV